MDDAAYKVILELRMVSDPWPLDQEKLEVMDQLLDREAVRRGMIDWVDAYHQLLPGPTPTVP